MKLLTVKNYATLKGFTTQHIYRKINDGSLKCKIIDGVKFVKS